MERTCNVYMLKCKDGSYYTGVSSNLEQRVEEHNQGLDRTGYTFNRRPVVLVWSQEFPSELQAREREHQIKGWSRAKKEALIREDWDKLKRLSRRSGTSPGRKGASRSEPVEE